MRERQQKSYHTRRSQEKEKDVTLPGIQTSVYTGYSRGKNLGSFSTGPEARILEGGG